MAPDNLLPDNDRDLSLAQLLEMTRSMGKNPEDIDDPLMPLLLQYKEIDEAELNRRSPKTSSIWTRIEAGLQKEQPPVYQLLTRSDMVRWIAAAAVVVITFTTFYWLFETRQPGLISESGETISTVSLNDGSIVTLRPYSSLYEISYSSIKQVYSVAGEAYFEVANNPDRRFVVETNGGRVIVLGTKFVLQNRETRTSVFLEEGRVRFETLDQSDYAILKPGEFSTITDHTITEPVQENSRVHKDWLQNILVLENQPVHRVLSEIEQHFNVTIDGGNAPDEKLGGSVQLDSLEQVLNDLSIVLGGTFEHTGENRYEYIPED